MPVFRLKRLFNIIRMSAGRIRLSADTIRMLTDSLIASTSRRQAPLLTYGNAVSFEPLAEE